MINVNEKKLGTILRYLATAFESESPCATWQLHGRLRVRIQRYKELLIKKALPCCFDIHKPYQYVRI